MLFAVHLIRMVLHGDSCYSARTLLDQRVFVLGCCPHLSRSVFLPQASLPP